MQRCVDCLFCRRATIPFIKVRDWRVSREMFHLCQCPECRLLITTPIPDEQTLGEYYDAPDYHAYGEGEGWMALLYRMVHPYTFGTRLRILQRYAPGRRLLDYGCGWGAFGRFAVRKGWDVIGVEIDEGARTRASQAFPTYAPQDQGWRDKTYDAVVLWHVLEHLPHPLETLQMLVERLSPRGILLVAVPHHDTPEARHYGPYWAGWDVPRHLYHYLPHHMERMLPLRLGLTLVKRRHTYLDGFYTAMLSERYRGSGDLPAILLGLLKGIGFYLRSPGKTSAAWYLYRKK